MSTNGTGESAETTSVLSSNDTYIYSLAVALLSTILRTYVWWLQAVSGISCLRGPAIHTNCTDKTLTAIPYNYTIRIANHSALPTVYSYMYTRVPFYGYGRTNFTALLPNITTASASLMYIACMGNLTCTQAWNASDNAMDQLVSYTNASATAIRDQIRNDSLTWIPSGAYAYAASYFTTVPDPGSEVLGVHNAVSYIIANRSLSQPYVQATYFLKMALTGGYEMAESLMHIVALKNANPYLGIKLSQTQIRLARRRSEMKPAPYDDHPSNSLTPIHFIRTVKERDLRWLSTLRGPARRAAWQFDMEYYLSLAGVALEDLKAEHDLDSELTAKSDRHLWSSPLHPSANARQLDSCRVDYLTVTLKVLDLAISGMCTWSSFISAYLPNIPKTIYAEAGLTYTVSQSFKNSPIVTNEAVQQFLGTQLYNYNFITSTLNIADIFCHLSVVGPAACAGYPGETTDPVSGSTLQAAFQAGIIDPVLLGLGASNPWAWGLDIGCLAYSLASDWFGQAATCCTKFGCSAPSCLAGTIGCVASATSFFDTC